jgi:hypothetical protein
MSNLISASEKLASADTLSGNEKDGNLEIEGKLDGGEYILTVDKNGNILGFKMPNNKLTMSFSDVTSVDSTNQTTQTTAETAAATTTSTTTAA